MKVSSHFCQFFFIFLNLNLFFKFIERRNVLGENQFFVGKHHKGYDFLRGLVGEVAPSSGKELEIFEMDPSYFGGISGSVLASEKCVGAGE
jgi:hypothetical protein